MTRLSRYLLSSGLLVIVLGWGWSACAQSSQWVFPGADGKLQYKALPKGDHIMDFSWAGYMGGGVALPIVPVKVTVNPSGGDDTTAIQSAINSVSAMPLVGGFRGAVLLAPGAFHCNGTLTIGASGVVLRGSGSGAGGTTVNLTGSPHIFIRIHGSGTWQTTGSVNITDSYVPSGTNSFHVSSASGFSVGDTVLITRTVTTAWIHFMGMDTLVRNGTHETWIAAGSHITTDRIVTAVSGNQITLDAPLTDSFDSQFLGTPVGTIAHYTFPGRISQVGMEHLHVIGQPLDTDITTPQYQLVNFDAVVDGWASDVLAQDTINGVFVNHGAKRLTLDQVSLTHTIPHTTAAGPEDFNGIGTQILFNKCVSNGQGSFPFSTMAEGTGPIVYLNCTSTQHAGVSPHMRWTTGILSDGLSVPNAPSGTQGISYRDRGVLGSGHGWTTGFSVAWNVTTPFFLVQMPPGTENWCIGCVGAVTSEAQPGGNGTIEANGIYDSLNTKVTPASLYLAQLCERLGPAALTNIGYGTSNCIAQTPSFSLSASPSSNNVTAGAGATYTAMVTPSGGFSGSVGLSVAGLPAGASASFAPTSISGGSGSSTLTVSTSPTSTPPGTYTLTITGTSDSLSSQAMVTLVVKAAVNPDFSVSALPSAQTVAAGGSTTYAVTVGALNGFTGTVALNTGSLPAGVTASFNPAAVTGSGTSTLTVSTSPSATTGSITIPITGTSGSTSHNASVGLTISPTAVCVTATGNGTVDNSAFPSHSGTFTATFDMTPSSGGISGFVGLSHGVQTANTGFANIVALSTSGFFQVRDGGNYFTSTIPYTMGLKYHVRLDINVTAHTYSAFVTPPVGSEQTIRAGAAFRTEQNTVTSLDHWGVKDSTAGSTLQVCGFTVQ
jgi:hypothetical protein